jgi:hypothetical protein
MGRSSHSGDAVNAVAVRCGAGSTRRTIDTMDKGDRHGSRIEVERDVKRLVEHGRDREAVELATRELASKADADGLSKSTEAE